MKSITSNDFGNSLIVEDCQKVNISELLRALKPELKALVINAGLESLPISIKLLTSKTGLKGIRVWFECPNCKARVGTLYKHPLLSQIACRKCLNLKYRKSRFKGMPESGSP